MDRDNSVVIAEGRGSGWRQKRVWGINGNKKNTIKNEKVLCPLKEKKIVSLLNENA